ncbi:MAG: bifunctional metallophosphatase/5'-nucleotidase [Deltaproteobacteria bacterium]|nr:MAG: bifunctional metallophosphatase/5'-nucleotidase [Deltaproteobacteria bacterium]
MRGSNFRRSPLRLRRRWLMLILLSLATAVSACGRPGAPTPELKDRDVSLTILHTSDIHSRVLSYRLTPLRTDTSLGLDPEKAPFGGLARIMTILRRERAKSQRAIHLDSGDLFQGAPIFNVFRGEPELRSLSLLGLDAYVLGNHDFDNGGLVLSRQIALWSSLPMLSANYIYLADSRRRTADMLVKLTQPYIILQTQGLKIGVIGLANTSTLTSLAEGGNSLGITAREPNEVLQRYINLLRSQVDLLVALTHIGLTEDEHLVSGYYREVNKADGKGLERKWVEGVRGLDVVIGGHHHVVLNPPKVIKDPDGRDVLVVHSGAFAKFVGRLDLVIHNGEVRSYRFRALPVNGDIPEDPDMLRMLEPYVLKLNQEIDTTRVFAFAPLQVPRFGRGTGDSALGNLVADSMKIRQRVEADFSLTNSLGIRTDLQAGPVSLEQFYEIFPFENSITTLFLSGREVQEMLDFVTDRSSGRGCQSQAQVSGISFVMNCKERKAESICMGSKPNPLCSRNGGKLPCFDPLERTGPKACLAGTPINEFTSYKLAANDYIANGGSGFDVLQRNTTQFNTRVQLRDALIEFIEGLPNCDTVDQERQKQGLPSFKTIIPDIYRKDWDTRWKFLPCVLGSEDGRIRRRLQ